MASRAALSYEGNDVLESMASQLGVMLSAQEKREREAWCRIHMMLPTIVCFLSAANNRNTTTDILLSWLKESMKSLHLGHSEGESLFLQIIGIFEERIRAEHADVSQAISLLKKFIALVADKLNMLPIRDSKHEHMIKGHTFCQDKVDEIIKYSEELSAPNAHYVVVSIVGAQSSGKSFLLNQLFGTDFPVMNAVRGRSRTTQGILISRCIRPSLLILDVEGFDGREKAQDTSFENQAALFTLTTSDLMMVNISLFDINREQGGGAQLFKTIFQERTKLPPGLTRIIIVVRLYDGETPLHLLEDQVVRTMEEFWKSVHENRKDYVEFRDYIDVKVVALPDKKAEDFQKEVTELRKLISRFSTLELSAKVPASSFSHSSKLLWDQIKQNKRLDIPSHKVIVATAFCNRIVEEALKSLGSHKEYELLKGEESPRGFKKISDTLLDRIIAKYDQETEMYDAGIREKERKKLEHEIKKIFAGYSKKLIRKMRDKMSEQFEYKLATNLKNMEGTDDGSIYIGQIDPCIETFTNLCEDLSLFDSDYFHKICGDLQKKLHVHTHSQILKIMEERKRTEVELAQKRNDKNVQELIMKLEETMKERQRMDEELKREMETQDLENRKATEELQRAHERVVAMHEQEKARLREELERERNKPRFSLPPIQCPLM